MPNTLMQQLFEKPSRKYNSSNVNFYSPATDPHRRRKAASDAGSYAGSDTDSIRSGFSSTSLYSATSLGRAHHADGRRRRISGAKYSSINGWMSSVSTLATEAIPENASDLGHLKTSRTYGKSLTPGFNKQESTMLRAKSVKTIQEQTAEARQARLRKQSAPAVQGWKAGDEEDDDDVDKPVRRQHRRGTSVGSNSSETAHSTTRHPHGINGHARPAWIAPDESPTVPQLPNESPVKPAAKPFEIHYNNQIPSQEEKAGKIVPSLTAANLAQLHSRGPITSALPALKTKENSPPASPTKSPSYLTEVANGNIRSRGLDRVQEEGEEESLHSPPNHRVTDGTALESAAPAALPFPHNLSAAIADDAARPSPPDSPPVVRSSQFRRSTDPQPRSVNSDGIPAPMIGTTTKLITTGRPRNEMAAFTLTSLEVSESANTAHPNMVKGIIKTARDHVEAMIRFTRDAWSTQADLTAVVDRVRGSQDEWSFMTVLPARSSVPQTSTEDRIEMCVKMFGDGKIVWDSDNGNNYSVVLNRASSANAPTTGSATPAKAPDTDPEPTTSRKSSVETFVTSDEVNAQSPIMSATSPTIQQQQENSQLQQQQEKLPPRILLTRTPSASVPSSDLYPRSSSMPDSIDMSQVQRMAGPSAHVEPSSMQQNPVEEPYPVLPGAAVVQIPVLRHSASRESTRQSQLPEDHGRSVNGVSTVDSSSRLPRSIDGVATLGQLFDPQDFQSTTPSHQPVSRTQSKSSGHHTLSPQPSIRSQSRSLSNGKATVSRGASGRTPLPVKLDKIPSARRQLTRPDWTMDAVLDPKTTMCAIEINRTKGKPGVQGSSSFRGHKKSASKDKGNDSTSSLFASRQFFDVQFTQDARVNGRIKSREVLVQVHAVAVDFYDAARVDTLIARMDGIGFIPGRSFCGRVIDCGTDVKLKKNDFVFGLTDVVQSGALAEVVVVDKRNVALAPKGDKLSIEQIAVLSMSGIPALTAVRQLSSNLPKNARVLVTNAHVGSGYLATQLLNIMRPNNDLYIAAQVPPDTLDAEALCKANGVTDVFRDDPVPALNRLHESSFDVVLDTIGGRRIYDASRRILHDEGYFCTLVGDELSPPTFKTQWKASLRSLRRAFVKKDRKSISYWLPMMAEVDTRSALIQLRDYVEEEDLLPVVSRIWRFEDGAQAFSDSYLNGGGVVRILE